MSNTYNIVAEAPESTVVAEFTPAKVRSDSYQSEADLEKAFIRQLTEQGYEHLPIHSEAELIANLRKQLEALKAENATLKKQAETHRQDRDKAESARNEAEQKAEKASADFAAYREKVEGERREARVSELVKAGKVKPAEKAFVLDFAAKLAELGGGTVDFAAPDGKTESLSMEERYFRELGARPVDERAADFAASVHGEPARGGNINPADLTAKL